MRVQELEKGYKVTLKLRGIKVSFEALTREEAQDKAAILLGGVA